MNFLRISRFASIFFILSNSKMLYAGSFITDGNGGFFYSDGSLSISDGNGGFFHSE